MKKRVTIIAIVLAAAILLAAVGLGLYYLIKPEQNVDDGQETNTEANTEDEPSESPVIDQTQFSTLIGKFTEREIIDESSAILAVQDVAEDLGLENAAAELTAKSTNTVDNLTYYRLQQNYQGIPVYGSTFVVISDENGQAQGVTGNVTNVVTDISLIPSIDYAIVEENINSFFGEDVLCPQLNHDNLSVYYDKSDELWALAYLLTVIVENEPFSVVVDAHTGTILQYHTLVYTDNDENVDSPSVQEMLEERVDVYDAEGKQFCRYIVLIDGVEHIYNQKKLYSWDGKLQYSVIDNRVIDSQGNLVDVSRWTLCDKLYLLHATSDTTVKYDKLEKMDEPSGVTKNDRANILVEELAKAHGFFVTVLERNGYDDNDGDIVAVIDDILYDNNAYSASWSDKTIICIGTNQAISTDLVAHEYMHSVEKSISNMVYRGESGAIMEGYSDIFGEIVEDWINDGLDGDCDWIHGHRNMHNPVKVFDYDFLSFYPATYKGFGYVDPIENSAYDHGAVHHNSTVISHAANYMVGMVGEGDALTSKELADLWYHTLFLLPSDCTFETLRNRMEATAIIIGLSEKKQERMRDAFDYVKIESNKEDVNTSFKLCVLDEDLNAFNNCSILIQKYEGSGKLWWYEENYVLYQSISSLSINPIDLVLPKGNYRIIVANKTDEDQVFVKHISTDDRNTDGNVIIYTYFVSDESHTHSYTKSVQAPTCTTAGWEKEMCSCGAEQNVKTIPALGHIFSDWVVTKQPTATEKGEQTRTCSGCGKKETAEIPCIEEHVHSYVTTTQPATCTATGLETKTCECGDVITTTLPMIDHNYVGGKCSVCGDQYVASVGLEFELNDDGTGYIVTGKGTCNDIDVIIPKTYEGLPILGIGDRAFYNCTGLTNITIPKSVTTIDSAAFSGCTGLTSITIPENVTTIGTGAFAGCTGLTSITIPENVTSIGAAAFGSCTGLTSIVVDDANPVYHSMDNCLIETATQTLIFGFANSVIPDSVTSIGNGAFAGCTNLTSISIPENVTSIEDEAFSLCTGLTNVSIPNSVTSIGASAFYGCTELNSLVIGNGVANIGRSAFAYCSSLTSLTLPNSVTKMDWYAFAYCGMTSLTIPDGVTSIGELVFYGCSNLTTVYMADSITIIYGGAFRECTAITDVYYSGSKAAWEDIPTNFGNDYLVDATIHYNWWDADSDLYKPADQISTGLVYELNDEQNGYVVTGIGTCTETKILIPATYDGLPVVAIGDEAFRGCSQLTSIALPDSLISIGVNAFRECTGLRGFTIPDNVTIIGEDAFYGCTRLTTVTIGGSVRVIDAGAFYNCTSLTNITIPDSVTMIGAFAFQYCESLTSIVIPDGVTAINNNTFCGCTSLSSVVIPEGVTIIDSQAFWGCSFTSFTIPNSVTAIGSAAFYDCINLTDINIPESVTSIGDYAFRGCASLTSVDMPDYLGSIGKYAFALAGLTSITIPNGVATIDEGVFDECINLTRVAIPDTVTFIGDYAFYGCSSLISVTIPDSVTCIGEAAFGCCTSLTSITIPDSVTSIGASALWGCSSLLSITIPFVGGSVRTASDSFQYPLGYIFGTDSYTGGAATQQRYHEKSASYLTRTTFYIPMGLTTVTVTGGSLLCGAFYNCTNLKIVTVSDDVTSIDTDAFYNCTNLKSITIGNSVASIGSNAFYNCIDLTDIYYTGSEEEWATIKIYTGNSYLTNATIHYNYVPEE